MKVALAGSRFVNGDMAFNLTQIEHWAREARRRGAELICFGEAFLQGFDALCWSYETDTNIAVRTDSSVFTRLKALSAGLGIDLLLGYIEKEGESLYSSCALIEGGRLAQNYHRISRGWKEYTRTDAHYREGVEPIVFSYWNKKCLIGLCGDLWDFPERFALGEDLLFWPVYIDYTPEEWEGSVKDEYALQAKKCCSRVLLINSLCRKAGASGGACLFENGKVLRELPMGREELLLVELD